MEMVFYILGVIVLIIIGIVFISWFSSKAQSGKYLTNSAKELLMQSIAEKVIVAVSQKFEHYTNSDKLKEARELLKENLSEYNINLSDELLDVLIESAVKRFKITLNSAIEHNSKE